MSSCKKNEASLPFGSTTGVVASLLYFCRKYETSVGAAVVVQWQNVPYRVLRLVWAVLIVCCVKVLSNSRLLDAMFVNTNWFVIVVLSDSFSSVVSNVPFWVPSPFVDRTTSIRIK